MATPASGKRKFCDFAEQTITVSVGPEDKEFAIHRSLLVSSSKHFEARFSGKRIPYAVQLPDSETSARTFQLYCCWLYTGAIDFSSVDICTDEKDLLGTQRFWELARLYVLGEKIQDKAFRNAVLDHTMELEKKKDCGSGIETIKLAFEQTDPDSPFCRWLVDNALHCIDPEWLRKRFGQLPRLYEEKLIIGWAKATWDKSIRYEKPISQKRCLYHEHDNELSPAEACDNAAEPRKKRSKQPRGVPNAPRGPRRGNWARGGSRR